MATVQALGGNPGQGVDLATSPKNATRPFRKNNLPSVKVAVTTTSQPVQLPRNFSGDAVLRVHNTGTSIVRIRYDRDNTVVATPLEKGIAPGSVELFSMGEAVGWVGVIGDAAGSVEFQCGFGL